MTEPTRLNRSNGLAGALLASAKTDAAPSGASRRALAGVAAITAGAAGAGVLTKVSGGAKAATALQTLARWATWKWVAIGVAGAGSVVTVGASVVTRHATPAPLVASDPASVTTGTTAATGTRATRNVHGASPQPPVQQTPPTLAAPPPELPASATVEPAIAPAPHVEARAPVTTAAALPAAPPPSPPPTRTAQPSRLAAEIAALDDAKKTLATGDAATALTKLDAYMASYPRGTLASEASALRIQALARSGHSAEAHEAFTRFRADNPGSPLLDNLEHELEGPR